jgi:DNA-binding GntR family transcriptional regulator
MASPQAPAVLDIAQPRVTAHEFVLNTLRRSILGGTLPGGSRLVQADIAQQLSVSTTPVREALRDLAAEGLVLFKPHVGAVVRELDPDEVVELYDVRKSLEPLAIRRAATQITAQELADAHALSKEMEAEADPAAWAELNHRFHAVLEDAARAPIIQSVLQTVRDIAAIYVAHTLITQPSRMSSGNKEHRAILAALRRQDGDAAAALLVAHLDATLQSILKAKGERPGSGTAAKPGSGTAAKPAALRAKPAAASGRRGAGSVSARRPASPSPRSSR